jgi:synaptic vesicle membrane protein VAT-1
VFGPAANCRARRHGSDKLSLPKFFAEETVRAVWITRHGGHQFVRDNGCEHVIDYRTQDYGTVIRQLTSERGVDLVLDALGGRDWKKGYALLRPTGMLIAFGFANMNTGGRRNLPHVLGQLARVPFFSPMKLMNGNKAVAGVNMGHLFGEVELLAKQCAALIRLYELGQVKPHVSKAFPFSEAAAAHAELEFAKNVGKVLLLPD